MEEKKTSEISLSGQHSNDPGKRRDPEKVVEEGREAGQVESQGALQESPGARAEVVFLPEMVRWTHRLVQPTESSFSQRALHIA